MFLVELLFHVVFNNFLFLNIYICLNQVRLSLFYIVVVSKLIVHFKMVCFSGRNVIGYFNNSQIGNSISNYMSYLKNI